MKNFEKILQKAVANCERLSAVLTASHKIIESLRKLRENAIIEI